jgi:hypothetical protein
MNDPASKWLGIGGMIVPACSIQEQLDCAPLLHVRAYEVRTPSRV